jgi:excisionase family DNA binding protein
MEQVTSMENSQRLTLTVEEVAAMLGIARHSAYKACHQGELPVIKLGRRFLIPKVAFDRMLAEARKNGEHS